MGGGAGTGVDPGGELQGGEEEDLEGVPEGEGGDLGEEGVSGGGGGDGGRLAYEEEPVGEDVGCLWEVGGHF